VKELFGNRSFLSVWSAQFISGLGDKIVLIALFSLVLDITGDVLSLGLLAALQIMPGVLMGPAIGVVLDRCDRKRAMIFSDILCAVAVAAIPFAGGLIWIYALAVVLAVGRQLTGPARLALIPDIVPADSLKKTNALAMLTGNLVLLLGMAAGGVLVAAVGTRIAFWVDAGTFLASAIILTGVRDRRPVKRSDADSQKVPTRPGWSSLLSEGRHGVAAIWNRPRLRFAVAFLAAVTVVTAMQPPLVFDFVKNGLGRGDRDLGFIFAAAGLGGIAGAFAAGFRRDNKRPLASVTRLVALDGLLLILFSLNRSVPAAAVLFGCFGAISTGLQVNLTTFLQRETDEGERGRIFGWLNPLLGPISLFSVLAGPALGRQLGVGNVLMFAGGGEVVAAAAGAFFLGRIPRAIPTAAVPPDVDSAAVSALNVAHPEKPAEQPRAMSNKA